MKKNFAFKLLITIIVQFFCNELLQGSSSPIIFQDLKEQTLSREQITDLLKEMRLLADHFKKEDFSKIAPIQTPKSGILSRVGNAGLIILISVSAAVIYGLIHDNVTARLCPEYFNSPAHSPHYKMMQNMGFQDPSTVSSAMIALYFGVLATWWVGAILGVGVASCAEIDNDLPEIKAKELVAPMLKLEGAMLLGVLLSGLFGYVLANNNIIKDNQTLNVLGNKNKHDIFWATGYSHNAAYLIGILGGIYIMWNTVKRRFRNKQLQEKESFANLFYSLTKEAMECKSQKDFVTLKNKLQKLTTECSSKSGLTQ